MANVERLTMIQAIITRLAGNAFLLKGWTVTLAAGLSAFATADSDATYAWIAVVVVVLFGLLDACYLALERKYRDLYNTACEAAATGWSLSPTPLKLGDVVRALFSWSVLPLHGTVAAGAVCVAALS